MAAYYGTEAWVLSSRERGEADRLITLFTKDLGRIDAYAKGVRLAKSKLKGHLNLFSRVRVVITPASPRGEAGKEYWRLLDAETVGTGEFERRNGYTQKFAKLFLSLAVEQEADWDLWDMLERFAFLDSGEKLARLKIQTFAHMGLLPGRENMNAFFTQRAIAFVVGESDGSFLADPIQERHFEDGIERILESNHMVYSKEHGT